MFSRSLLFVAALTIGAALGQAQPSATPEECGVVSPEILPLLEKRRQDLESELARTRATPTGPSLTKSQEDLLEVLFQIDCVNRELKQQPPEATRRGSASSQPEDMIEVTSYYATNRQQSGNAEPATFYGPGIESTLQYGRTVVSIPFAHTPGTIELPSLWKLERQADPRRHFVLKSVSPLSGDDARKEMTERIQGLSSKALLIFVHGYNVSFAEAALRTAQMAHDLKFPGVPFFYSWPSARQLRAYLKDEETARLSEGVFERLVDELSQLPVTDIYIVAHSMGSRIVGHALQRRVDKGKETKHLRELLLAAPDINAEIFRSDIAPALAAMPGMRTTMYASSFDLALIASKVAHGFRRVGESSGGMFVYPGFDSIDASSVSTLVRTYGHSYLVDSVSVIRDIQTLIHQQFAVKQRGLQPAGTAPNNYWLLR